MSAKDIFHDVVKNAFLKGGWTVTRDLSTIRIGGIGMEIDLTDK